MADSALAKKLGLKTGHTLLLLNAPASYRGDAAGFPGVTLAKKGPASCVQLFAKSRAELEKQGPGAVKAVEPGGLLWVCYPKLTSGEESDLKREVVWDAMKPTGWRPVAQISIDDVWSALRFRPVADVKSKAK